LEDLKKRGNRERKSEQKATLVEEEKERKKEVI